MSSYRQILYHIVFSTKRRKPSIPYPQDQKLYAYIAGIIKNSKAVPYKVNGTKDHIHILSDLPTTITLSDFIRTIKLSSGKWMKESGDFPDFDGWVAGFGAFTVSYSDKDRITKYISNQKEHHKAEPFYDEFKDLLIENHVEFDERYLVDD